MDNKIEVRDTFRTFASSMCRLSAKRWTNVSGTIDFHGLLRSVLFPMIPSVAEPTMKNLTPQMLIPLPQKGNKNTKENMKLCAFVTKQPIPILFLKVNIVIIIIII